MHIQPFEKRLGQNKHNLLAKGWTKTQPFGKRLHQNTTFWQKVGPKPLCRFIKRTCNNIICKFWSNLLAKGC